MKNIMTVCLIAVMAVALFSFVATPAHALSGTVAEELRSEAAAVGEAGFGEGTGTGADLPARVGRYIKIVLSVLGVILVVIIVYAGFLWMTAGGNDEQTKKARAWMTNAVIGLIIILAAYAITDFVIEKLITASTG